MSDHLLFNNIENILCAILSSCYILMSPFLYIEHIIPSFHCVGRCSLSYVHSFIHSFFHSLARAECDYFLPFSGASSIPLCCVLFPSTQFPQLVFHPSLLHLAISFSVYLSALLFPNSYLKLF